MMIHREPLNSPYSLPAILYSSFISVLFGANAVAIKVSLAGLGAFTAAGLRFGMASVVIALWAWVTGRSFALSRDRIGPVLVLGLLFTVQLSLLYFGMTMTHASRASLLVNLQPFIVLFLAHRFIPGDRITRRKAVGTLMGFGGVVLVFIEKGAMGEDFRSGDLLVLGNALMWAVGTVYTKRIMDDFTDTFHIVLYPMALSVPFFFLGGLLGDRIMIGTVDSRVLAGLLYQGLVAASFGFVAWNNLLQKYGAVALHSFVFLMPVVGVILGGLVLDEPVTPKIILSMVLVAAGILVVNVKFKSMPSE